MGFGVVTALQNAGVHWSHADLKALELRGVEMLDRMQVLLRDGRSNLVGAMLQAEIARRLRHRSIEITRTELTGPDRMFENCVVLHLADGRFIGAVSQVDTLIMLNGDRNAERVMINDLVSHLEDAVHTKLGPEVAQLFHATPAAKVNRSKTKVRS